ncbi:MAG: hypothetical protein RMY34_05880 [Aulosira sp. DedQUE10]|nr:hypothetical protein [Aulosira sp. DedQUE10]
MTNTPTNSKTQDSPSAKKKQSFPKTDIGSPKVPLKKQKTKQQHELLSDWEHAS